MSSEKNKTGFVGVRPFRRKWHARVMIHGKRVSSRGFATKERAAAWYSDRKRLVATA